MSFLNKLSALLPFGKKEEVLEYFFALNISNEKLTAALWTIEAKHLKILETASENYSSINELAPATDKLLDTVLGIRDLDPQKILFGVPSTWLMDENLKDEYLKVLRGLVKELELIPMAYVETAHALVHFLEKEEGVPPTAILVGFEERHLSVTVVRAGKLDGIKIITRGEVSGADIEKALLNFTSVETLPSKILIYDHQRDNLDKLKSQLLSFSWMSKLSFLHFPKIDTLAEDLEIKSVCLAGAFEINSDVLYTAHEINRAVKRSAVIASDESVDQTNDDLGFVLGDVSNQIIEEEEGSTSLPEKVSPDLIGTSLAEMEDFEREITTPPSSPVEKQRGGFFLKKFIPKRFRSVALLVGVIAILGAVSAAYFLLPKANVKIFVEPQTLERDAQVIADPNQKEVLEEAKIIPGQLVGTEVSGSGKDSATGKKQIGDPSKGTVKIINNANQAQTFSKGTTVTSTPGGIKFTLDTTVNVASTSAFADSKSTATSTVTASGIGADGNLPSGTQFTIAGSSSSQVAVVSEGNFSGGTSKEVTVVSDGDQKRLLAKLASDLRKMAQQKLQEKLPDKKILEEGLSEEITKRSYSKNVNDQASEFSLNLTAKYKGTAFEDKDLKLIVSKLVNTQIPEGFELNLADTETQAEVSKLDKGGKLIFLAKFKAKLIPKIDIEKVKDQIKGKTFPDAENFLKNMEHVLGSEINISPKLPSILQRLPILSKNINIEVGLK